jgi:Cu/Ag efflux pump CusA
LAQLMEDLIGDLTAVPQPIEIKLYGADMTALAPQAEKVAAVISGINGVVEVKSGVKLAGDALDLQIDPVRAGFEGVTADDIARAVDAALNGTVATQLPQATKFVGVRVRIPNASQLRETALGDLPIRAADGHVFPLRRVAQLVPVTGQPEISRAAHADSGCTWCGCSVAVGCAARRAVAPPGGDDPRKRTEICCRRTALRVRHFLGG